MESSMHVDLPSSMGLQRASLYVLGEKTQVKVCIRVFHFDVFTRAKLAFFVHVEMCSYLTPNVNRKMLCLLHDNCYYHYCDI